MIFMIYKSLENKLISAQLNWLLFNNFKRVAGHANIHLRYVLFCNSLELRRKQRSTNIYEFINFISSQPETQRTLFSHSIHGYCFCITVVFKSFKCVLTLKGCEEQRTKAPIYYHFMRVRIFTFQYITQFPVET